jgi:hypothetical protein
VQLAFSLIAGGTLTVIVFAVTTLLIRK